jgi:thiol:disulfide interchange protein
MKMLPVVLLLGLWCAGAWPGVAPAAEPPKAKQPKIYDEVADGGRQVAVALAQGRKENKRVLLQFGANWCPWCHKLHQLFQTDKPVAEQLKAGYIVVMLDVNLGHNKNVVKRYGDPIRFGLPVLVVLDAEGRHLTTKNTAELEEGDHHSPAKVLAFLEQWAPKPAAGQGLPPKGQGPEKPAIPSPKERML